MPQPIHETIVLDDCRLALHRAGDGPPLLYLHGAGGHTWWPFLDRLAERYTVWAPEHPGFGASDDPPWLDNTADLAYFYLDLLAERGLHGTHLIGESLGGWVALELAIRDAARLKSLTLVGAAGIRLVGVEKTDIFILTPDQLAAKLFVNPDYAQAFVAQASHPDNLPTGFRNQVTAARLGWNPRFANLHLAKWLHRITLPMHIVWGAQDGIVPLAYAHEFQRLIPHARLSVIEQAGHLPQAEQGETFIAACMAFFAEIAP